MSPPLNFVATECAISRMKHGGGSVMPWGCFFFSRDSEAGRSSWEIGRKSGSHFLKGSCNFNKGKFYEVLIQGRWKKTKTCHTIQISILFYWLFSKDFKQIAGVLYRAAVFILKPKCKNYLQIFSVFVGMNFILGLSEKKGSNWLFIQKSSWKSIFFLPQSCTTLSLWW